jgi:hypothetical protein
MNSTATQMYNFVPLTSFGPIVFTNTRLQVMLGLEKTTLQFLESIRPNKKGSITDIYHQSSILQLKLNYNDDWKLTSLEVFGSIQFIYEDINVLQSNMETVKTLSRARNYYCEQDDVSMLFLDTIGVIVKYTDDQRRFASSALICTRECYEQTKLLYQAINKMK